MKTSITKSDPMADFFSSSDNQKWVLEVLCNLRELTGILLCDGSISKDRIVQLDDSICSIMYKTLYKGQEQHQTAVVLDSSIKSVTPIPSPVKHSKPDGTPAKPAVDYKAIRETYFNTGKAVCPDCGSPLVKRKGKDTFFLGCITFPECRFTCNLNIPTSIDPGDVDDSSLPF